MSKPPRIALDIWVIQKLKTTSKRDVVAACIVNSHYHTYWAGGNIYIQQICESMWVEQKTTRHIISAIDRMVDGWRLVKHPSKGYYNITRWRQEFLKAEPKRKKPKRKKGAKSNAWIRNMIEANFWTVSLSPKNKGVFRNMIASSMSGDSEERKTDLLSKAIQNIRSSYPAFKKMRDIYLSHPRSIVDPIVREINKVRLMEDAKQSATEEEFDMDGILNIKHLLK